jgi:hypothetical protein
MKLTLALLVTTALGFGGFRAATTPDPLPQPPPSVAGECKVTVQCTPEGKCLIKCEFPDGKVCIKEVACEGGKCTVKSCQGKPCPPTACQ